MKGGIDLTEVAAQFQKPLRFTEGIASMSETATTIIVAGIVVVVYLLRKKPHLSLRFLWFRLDAGDTPAPIPTKKK